MKESVLVLGGGGAPAHAIPTPRNARSTRDVKREALNYVAEWRLKIAPNLLVQTATANVRALAGILI